MARAPPRLERGLCFWVPQFKERGPPKGFQKNMTLMVYELGIESWEMQAPKLGMLPVEKERPGDMLGALNSVPATEQLMCSV